MDAIDLHVHSTCSDGTFSAEQIVDLDLPGYAIGGLSVGEPKDIMLDVLDDCVDYLQKDAKANLSKVVSKESKEAKRAELEYEVLKTVYVQAHEQMPVTLVKIHLITGRHHQIRVQFASRGLPLLGDTRYGGQTEADCRMALQKSGKPLIQRYEIALCAYALTVDKKTYELALPWQV